MFCLKSCYAIYDEEDGMRKISVLILLKVIISLLLATLVFNPPASAKEVLRYSSSAQVREAFGMEGLNAFSAATGVEIDLFVGSSDSAVYRLMMGHSDIASTVERLHETHAVYGYQEIPFCKAPIVVVTNVKTPVRNVTSTQLRAIFSGEITSWKQLGGPEESIIVVVPAKDTGAFKNFNQLALKRSHVQYDFMAYRSTDVVKLVKRLPWSITFISQGAHTVNEAVKIISVDGLSPGDSNYPYSQTFSFVTKGKPCCAAEKFIDFAFSEEGRRIMTKNGMTPLAR